MGRAVDLLYSACHEFRDNGELFLDYDFMMGIFADLQKEIPEFNTYMTWFFNKKECNTIGSSSKSQQRSGNALLSHRKEDYANK